jgi:hypothetical protein
VNYKDGQYIFENDVNTIMRQAEGFGIVTGLVASANSGMVLSVSAGSAFVGSTSLEYKTSSFQKLTLSSNTSYPTKTIVYMDYQGNITFSSGTASTPIPSGLSGKYTREPFVPVLPNGSVLLSEVWMPVGSSQASEFTLYNANQIYNTAHSGIAIMSASSSILTVSTGLNDTNSVAIVPKDNLNGR